MKKILFITLASLLFFVLIAGNIIQAVPAGFVYRSGRNFMLDGKTFYYNGNNTYYAGLISDQTKQGNIFLENTNKGVKVLRIWAFNNGASGSIQPSIGSYNETALRQLDYAVKKAKDNGIKVILPFVNYWPDYNGMQWYVNQRGGGPIDSFYTNSAVKQDYKNYINMLVNRTNYYTGAQYKNEPAVFAWELANEPRCTSDTSGNTLYNWVNEMAAYIKSQDPNHMVSIGDEGFKKGGSDWTDNGSQGVDYVRNIGNANIDFGTFHLYPDDWGHTTSWANSYISDRISLCHNASKPAVLEEYGRKASYGDRDSVYTSWHNTATGVDIDGIMVWQMEIEPPWDTNYGFNFTSSTANLMAGLSNAQNGKSGGGGTPTASSTATPTNGGVTVKYNFENTLGGWSGVNLLAGPWAVTEWYYNGAYSLKADVTLAGGAQYYLKRTADDNYSGKTQLKAVVRHATWGIQGTGMQAKLYIKTGSGYQWFDGGAININSSAGGATLTLNLGGIANLSNVREVGVQYLAGSGSSGQSSIYIDYVTLQ